MPEREHNLSLRLSQLRFLSQLKVASVAHHVGVSVDRVYQWERGAATPNVDNLIKLAKYYSVSPNYLLDYDEPAPAHDEAPGFIFHENEDEKFPTAIDDIINDLLREQDKDFDEMVAVLEKGEDYANNLTHGSITPTLLDALRLAMWFGVTLDELVDRASIEAGGVEDPAPQAPAPPAPVQPASPTSSASAPTNGTRKFFAEPGDAQPPKKRHF